MTDAIVADASRGNWVDRLVPRRLRPYARLARLDRPIGWWLLLLPCLWSLALGQIALGGGWPSPWHALLFLIGAIVMRGAGCTLNDMADRDFDARVARTRSRPLPAGQITLWQAFAFLALQSAMGLAVLLNFDWFTVFLGAASLLIVAVYPFMKRFTYWPQLVLGLAFNWGALVGWSSLHGSLSAAPLALYCGGIAWTLAYDTIYAHQDKEDDALIGIKSTALKLGASTMPWLIAFFALALVLIDAAIWLAGGGFLAHIGVAAAGLHAAWQMARLDIDDPARCLRIFKSNRELGLIVLAGLLADSVTR